MKIVDIFNKSRKGKGTGMSLEEEINWKKGQDFEKAHPGGLIRRRRLSKTTGRDWLWDPKYANRKGAATMGPLETYVEVKDEREEGER